MKHATSIGGEPEERPANLNPDTSGTLAEKLFDRLTDAILRGELAPGSKISEPLLAHRFGVSRGPLREALHRLQERRLIVRSANQGARVVEPTPQMLASIFEVRESLEGMAARLAAALISDEELATLAALVRQHEDQLKGPEVGGHNALGKADEDFHYCIAQASRNPLLIDLLCNQLYPLLRLYRSRNDNRTLRERALAEHQRILAALMDRDPEMAELTMKRHIASAKIRRTMALNPPSAGAPRQLK